MNIILHKDTNTDCFFDFQTDCHLIHNSKKKKTIHTKFEKKKFTNVGWSYIVFNRPKSRPRLNSSCTTFFKIQKEGSKKLICINFISGVRDYYADTFTLMFLFMTKVRI